MRAVAHAAGYFVNLADRNMDANGVDLTIWTRGTRGLVRSPQVAVQLKTTAQERSAADVVIDLSVKKFEELIDDTYQVPRILVVVAVPEQIEHWVSFSEEELTLRHCGYWLSIRGHETTTNSGSQRIRIPRSSVFNVPSLQSMMASAATPSPNRCSAFSDAAGWRASARRLGYPIRSRRAPCRRRAASM